MQVNKQIGISPGCSLLSAAIALAENNQIIIQKICFRTDQRLVAIIDQKKLKKNEAQQDNNYQLS